MKLGAVLFILLLAVAIPAIAEPPSTATVSEVPIRAKLGDAPWGAPLVAFFGGADGFRIPGPVCSGTAVTNERVCVCACECGSFSDVQIRCDSNSQDCAALNGQPCEEDNGNEDELQECTRKFVKLR